MVMANFSSPSMATACTFAGVSRSRSIQSWASCMELLIDENIDSSTDLPSVASIGRGLTARYRLAISM